MEKSPMVILKEYFGYLPGQDLKGFGEEIKALSQDEKNWLVTEAAKQLGVAVKG